MKLNIRIPYLSTTPLIDPYPTKVYVHVHQETHKKLFMAALFETVPNRKLPRYPAIQRNSIWFL